MTADEAKKKLSNYLSQDINKMSPKILAESTANVVAIMIYPASRPAEKYLVTRSGVTKAG